MIIFSAALGPFIIAEKRFVRKVGGFFLLSVEYSFVKLYKIIIFNFLVLKTVFIIEIPSLHRATIQTDDVIVKT